MSYMIRNLEPSTQYEVRVQARNRFGWNEPSEIFPFSTRAVGKLQITFSNRGQKEKVQTFPRNPFYNTNCKRCGKRNGSSNRNGPFPAPNKMNKRCKEWNKTLSSWLVEVWRERKHENPISRWRLFRGPSCDPLTPPAPALTFAGPLIFTGTFFVAEIELSDLSRSVKRSTGGSTHPFPGVCFTVFLVAWMPLTWCHVFM